MTVSLRQALGINGVSNLSILVGNPNLTHGSVASVVCQAAFGLSFVNMYDLRISELSFEGCGAPSRLALGDNEVVNAALEANISLGLVFDHVNITRSPGIGLLLLNVRVNLNLSKLMCT